MIFVTKIASRGQDINGRIRPNVGEFAQSTLTPRMPKFDQELTKMSQISIDMAKYFRISVIFVTKIARRGQGINGRIRPNVGEFAQSTLTFRMPMFYQELTKRSQILIQMGKYFRIKVKYGAIIASMVQHINGRIRPKVGEFAQSRRTPRMPMFVQELTKKRQISKEMSKYVPISVKFVPNIASSG